MAKDGKGGVAESPVWRFTTTIPPEVGDASPENDSSGVPINVVLSWSATDVDNDNITYDLYFGTDEGNLEKIATDLEESSKLVNLEPDNTYYWKVVAKDGKGGITESPVWSFTTTIPPKIGDASPADRAMNIPLSAVLTWNATDLDGDGISYDVYFGRDNRNLSKVASGISEKSYELEKLGYHTTYYWKVVAKDGKGGITEGPVWRFTTRDIQIVWQKVLGGSDDDEAHSIQRTSDGGYVVAGYTSSNDGDVSGNHGGKDFWVIKLDSDGNIIWQRTFGGSNDDEAYSVQQTSDGGYIVAGYTGSNDGDVRGNHGYKDFWVIKLDENGDMQWQKALGGSSDDEAYSIQQTSDGGYIVVGEESSRDGDVSSHYGMNDIWIVRLNRNGNKVWDRTFGDISNDKAYSVQQTDDGGYVVSGHITKMNGHTVVNRYAWVVKLRRNGSKEWLKTFGDRAEAYSVQQTDDGGYIIVGSTKLYRNFEWDFMTTKLRSNGSILFLRRFGGSGGSDYGYSVLQTGDGNYVVAGVIGSRYGATSGNHGRLDSWIVGLDSGGNVEWQRALGGSDDDWAYSIQQTTDGDYIIAGYTKSTDGDLLGFTNHGGKDFWIVKLK